MQNKLHSEKVEQQDWWIYRKQSKIWEHKTKK
jgi:hypothetical protein